VAADGGGDLVVGIDDLGQPLQGKDLAGLVGAGQQAQQVGAVAGQIVVLKTQRSPA
jgi:hypothetical protein